MASIRYVLLLSFSCLVLGLVSEPVFGRDSINPREGQPRAKTLPIEARDAVPVGYVAAPYYPTPNGGWVSAWSEAYAKAQLVVGNMTLAEKVNLTTGTGLLMVGIGASSFVLPSVA